VTRRRPTQDGPEIRLDSHERRPRVFAVNETQHQHSLDRPPGLGAVYRLGQGCCPHATSAAKTPELTILRG
jgi:hypothetical protein